MRRLHRLAHTYSIVALEKETGRLGVAVQSHYFGVGPIVPWVEKGVGAVATQSLVEITYGPLGLDLMRAGKTAQEALTALVAADGERETRQVGMVDIKGNVAVHTGERCIPEAGHRMGDGYTVQANLMLNDEVPDAMAEAFENAEGDLPERLMVALEAAEEAGGDIRGRQSAALVVAPGPDEPALGYGFNVVDLRIEDHKRPLLALRRVLTIHRGYRWGDEATDPSKLASWRKLPNSTTRYAGWPSATASRCSGMPSVWSTKATLNVPCPYSGRSSPTTPFGSMCSTGSCRGGTFRTTLHCSKR